MDCIDRMMVIGISSGCDVGFVLFLFFFVVGDVEIAEFAQSLAIVVDFVFLVK